MAQSRLADALHSIQEDYSRVHAERNALRYELSRITTLASEQDSELSMIRRAIWNLQNQLQQYHSRFEEERLKLFDELRQQRAAAGLPPPSPLRELLNPVSLPAHPLPDDLARDTVKTRGRDYPEFESDERREPKRMRPNRDMPAPPLTTSKPYPRTPPSQKSSLPPHITTPTTAPPLPDDLSLLNVPPEFRKESTDYTITFNPRLPRTMDLDLVCSIPHPSVVCSIQFSPDGRRVATGCNQAAHIYDTKTGTQICSLIDPSLPKDGDLYIRSVRFSPDGEYLATGGEDQRVRVWHLKSQSLRHVFAGHTNEIYALDYAQNGNFIVSGSADRTARLWDLRGNTNDNNKNHKTFKYESNTMQDCGVTSISIIPTTTCQFVAGGCLDGCVRIWNIETGEVVRKLRGHEDSVYAIKFTGDGKRLVSGSLDCSVKYWDTTSLLSLDGLGGCGLVGNMKGHQDYVLAVACSSDNRWVVSGSKDRSLVLWDPLDGLPRFKLLGHKNSVISVDINGPYIATASGDMFCRIWAYSSKDR
ncbi:hypothetical protein Agabi119p4_8377 [Agaricus bisporus var. burnettii]|uniref:Transcriptional repressor Tup1 N-terminal domain-containing protein n=1 Tax=Agaricus bisporus var. burnettii TaxID=192524 RepID=A0A8H7C6Z8_AGABI|nr:hypothetical protein Agabi119p4_8377 [Agaricus bisporus var. burnettii]